MPTDNDLNWLTVIAMLAIVAHYLMKWAGEFVDRVRMRNFIRRYTR